MSSFTLEQLETTLPNLLCLAEKGINNEVFFTYPDGSYQIKHRTNLSAYYSFPYLEMNQFLLGMKAIDARKNAEGKRRGLA